MSKLYPPNIEGILPAFSGTTLVVPFSMNKTVGANEYSGLKAKIKTVQSNTYLGVINSISVVTDPNIQATFNLKSITGLTVGQYYKVQMAYVDETDEIGYYSTVGVVKYTTAPSVSILNLNLGQINTHQNEYIGLYSQKGGDATEKVYSYCFNLYDENDNLIKTSGVQIHNSSEDTETNESTDSFTVDYELENGHSYYLEYSVTTINGLEATTGKYRIMQQKSIDPEIDAELVPTLNFENGYIDLKLVGNKNAEGVETNASGAFRILRSSDEDNYATWNEILKFALYGQQPSRWLWRDCTIQQGVYYKYALQQYNDDNNLFSNRLETDAIYADFEHAFLFDGEKQLKIKYNPKVASFKNSLLEQKNDTIGNKYPFIFRNGNVKYKEFSIAGLISYLADDEFLYLDEEILSAGDGTINLTSENIATERKYKLDVLDWLTNGEPKVFRSPTEGNYIVRLMNVSLSPNDNVGRMLHTFSCTAYEVADFTFSNLSEYSFIATSDPVTSQLRWETIDLAKVSSSSGNLLSYNAVSLRFEAMVPGDQVTITLSSGESYNIVIGATGGYNLDLSLGLTITRVSFTSHANYEENTSIRHQGQLTYGYYSKMLNKFDTIQDVEFEDVPLQQFIGEHDIIDEITDIRTEIAEIFFVHFSLREVLDAYEYPTSNEYYSDSGYTQKLTQSNIDPYALYKIANADYYLSGYDLMDGKTINKIYNYSTEVVINNVILDLSENSEWYKKDPPDITSLEIGSGVMGEISYQKRIIEYQIEKTNSDISSKKNDYLLAKNDLISAIQNTSYSGTSLAYYNWIKNLTETMNSKYTTFIDSLIAALKELEAESDV